MRDSLQKKRDHEHNQMRSMIAQGLHKSKSGLQITAWHLPKELSVETVQRYRRDALEDVEKKSKRIKQGLSDAKKNRNEIKNCAKALKAVEEERCMLENKERMQAERARDGSTSLLGSLLTVDVVNKFSEESLNSDEKAARDFARDFGVAIPDVEFIQAQFKLVDKSREGITREDFPKILKSLMDESDTVDHRLINKLWRSCDSDGMGRVNLSQYLLWHLGTFGSPKLSSRVMKASRK
jgi:hypothetical protein